MDQKYLNKEENEKYVKLETELKQSQEMIQRKHQQKQDYQRLMAIYRDYVTILGEFGDNVAKVSRLTPLCIIELKDWKVDVKTIENKIKNSKQQLIKFNKEIEELNKIAQGKEKPFIEFKQEMARKIKARSFKDEQRAKRNNK